MTAKPIPPPSDMEQSSSAKKKRGRPASDGIGKHKTEEYRKQIPLNYFESYTFPTGKPKKAGTQLTHAELDAIEHRDEVVEVVISDMYVELTNGVIVPQLAPVDYHGKHVLFFNTYIFLFIASRFQHVLFILHSNVIIMCT
jgi:hypothetical protein